MKYFFLGLYKSGPADLTDEDSTFILQRDKLVNKPGFRDFKSGNVFISHYSEDDPTPYVYESETLFITGRCRFDNQDELYSGLGIRSHESEPELIALAYQKWGIQCLEHFIGDFSFVLWDKTLQKLYLAKDQIGIRPLYYMIRGDILYFSTGIPILKAALPFKPALNLLYIAKELKKYQQDVEDTFFDEIKRLAPAHFMVAGHASEPVIHRYWDLEPLDLSHIKSEKEFYQLLEEKMTEAVLCRTRGKKTIGCQLSGGMDSSAIAVILARSKDTQHIHTYSFVLNDHTGSFSDGIDERETQELMLDYAGLRRENHHPIEYFHFKDVFEELETINNVMGGIANSNSIWQDTLFREAAKHDVEVSFSGFPGDEGISNNGNRYHLEYLYQKDIKGIFSHLYAFRLRGLKSIISYYLSMFRGKNSRRTDFDELRDLMDPDSPYQTKISNPEADFYPSFKMFLKQRMLRSHTCLRTESEGAYALQYGIETVYPLADIRLLQLVYSLPVHMFRPKPYPRAIFRNLCKDILPDKVRLQPKLNGAKTLAFVDYWYHLKYEQLESTPVKNHTGLMISEADILKKSTDHEFVKKKRFIDLKEMDYLIGLNWPEA